VKKTSTPKQHKTLQWICFQCRTNAKPSKRNNQRLNVDTYYMLTMWYSCLEHEY